MKTLTELLRQWAEMEPGRVEKKTSQNLWFLSTYRCPISADYELAWKLGAVQFEVQQAVESQGWLYEVQSTNPSVYLSIIRKPTTAFHKIPDRIAEAESRDSPARALLAAYIKALEAVAEVVA